MIIKFNNIEIEDIKVLEQKELKALANFNIELIETNNEWIQFFCEDDTVSIAMKKNNTISYYNHINKEKINNLIQEYYNDYKSFEINYEKKKKVKNKQSLERTAKNLFYIFFLFLLLMIIQFIMIGINSTHSGSFFQKIVNYYLDSSKIPKQKSLPLFVIFFFIMFLVYIIRIYYEKNKKKRKNKYN